MQETDHRYILQRKADHQGSKIQLRDFRWIDPYVVEKVLRNKNYLVRNICIHETQILQLIRLRKFTTDPPLEDSYTNEKFRPHVHTLIPQDDFYSIPWESDFIPSVIHHTKTDRDPKTIENTQSRNSVALLNECTKQTRTQLLMHYIPLHAEVKNTSNLLQLTHVQLLTLLLKLFNRSKSRNFSSNQQDTDSTASTEANIHNVQIDEAIQTKQF